MKNYPQISIILFLSLLGLSARPGLAQEAGEGYSLEDSLIQLKQSAQQAVIDNKKFKIEIDHIQRRIPVLEIELENMRGEKAQMMNSTKRVNVLKDASLEKTKLLEDKLRRLQKQKSKLSVISAANQKMVDAVDKKKEKWQNQVRALQAEIRGVEKKLAIQRRAKNTVLVKEKQKKNELVRLIEQSKDEIKRQQKVLEKNVQLKRPVDKRIEVLTEEKSELSQKVAVLQNQLDTLNSQQQEIQREMNVFTDEQQQELAALDSQLDKLRIYQSELSGLIDMGETTSQELSGKFQKHEEGLYIKTIHKLLEQNDRLKDNELGTMRQLEVVKDWRDAIKDTNMVRDNLDATDNRLNSLRSYQEQLMQDIADAEGHRKSHERLFREEEDSLERVDRDLKASERETKKLFSVETRGIDRDIEDQETDVLRARKERDHAESQYARPAETLRKLNQANSDLRNSAAMMEAEIQDTVEVRRGAEKMIQLTKGEQEAALKKLNNEIRKLELYGEELIGLLDTVDREFQKGAGSAFELSRSELQQLQEHMAVLRTEKDYLEQKAMQLTNDLNHLDSSR